MKQVELVRGHHSVGESNYHIIFCPKYRKPLFVHQIIRERIEQYIREKLSQFNINLISLEFGPDHLHMFWSNVKRASLEKVIGQVKGYSGYMIKKEVGELVEQYIWKKGFWSAGYFYRSIGAVTNERIKTYIEKSQDKHFLVLDTKEYIREKQKTLASFLDVAFRPLPTLS